MAQAYFKACLIVGLFERAAHCSWQIFDKARTMSTLNHFLIWNLGCIFASTLVSPAWAHSELHRPMLNVIPGNACGLQTEMRYVDALGKKVFSKSLFQINTFN